MTILPTIYFDTPRLQVRSFRAADVASFTAYRSDPEVARYQSWSNYTRERGEAFVAAMQGAEPGVTGQWFQFALEDRAYRELVGDLAFKISNDEPREAEIGFTLAPAYHGRGYATEALTGLLDYAFGSFPLHRVIAVTDALNAPAAALLTRVGMRREAHFVENVFFKGAWGSEFLFAILDHEWSAGH